MLIGEEKKLSNLQDDWVEGGGGVQRLVSEKSGMTLVGKENFAEVVSSLEEKVKEMRIGKEVCEGGKERQKSAGFQEENGVFIKHELKEHAMVISQGWPSWSFALEGLGFASVSTIASFESESSKTEFQATAMGDTLVAKEELDHWLERIRLPSVGGIVFVQGEQAFLDVAYRKLHSTEEPGDGLRIVYVCSDVTFTSDDGFRISHLDAGGITDGEWSFYTEMLDFNNVTKSRVVRSLRHILRTTEGAASSKQLRKVARKVLEASDLLPFGEKINAVKTRSVFHKEELVTRFLSGEELMDGYDLELSVQAAIKSHCKSRGESSTRSFVNQVPTKVLRLVVKQLIETTLVEESMIISDELGTGASLHEEKIGDRVCTSRLAMPKGRGVSPGAVEEVAARPDDAEAKAEDWDDWLVTSFASPCGKEPLVCRGKYEEEKHAPLFNALRKLLIRQYRRNVLQSYLAFM